MLFVNWTLLTYTILLPFDTLARPYKRETITSRCVTLHVRRTCCAKTLTYNICLLGIKLLSLHGFYTKLIKRTDFSHDPPPLLCPDNYPLNLNCYRINILKLPLPVVKEKKMGTENKSVPI